MFLENTSHTKIALVACCAGFYDRWMALLGCSLEAKLIASLLEVLTQNVADKIQRYSFLLMSATLLTLYEGWLSFSVTHGFSKAY